MKLNVLLALTVVLVAGTRGFAAEPFAPGQSWIYKPRPGEDASRVFVYRVDDYPKVGKVIHVMISGLLFQGAPGTAPEPWQVKHAPFAEAVLRRSVTARDTTKTAPPPSTDFEQSYAKWKKAADGGKVQHWTSSVTDVVKQVEKWVREGRR